MAMKAKKNETGSENQDASLESAISGATGSLDSLSQPSASVSESSAQDFEAIRGKLQEAEEADAPKPRGRPRKYKQRESTPAEPPRRLSEEEKAVLVRPLFGLANMILEKRGIEPLDEDEISQGVQVWTPIIERYLPSMERYSIWIPPALWVVTVS